MDQDKALAWLDAQRQVCSGCGTRQVEWDADPFAYIGDFYQCRGCETLELERDNVPETMKGVKVSLLPKRAALIRAESLGDSPPPNPLDNLPGL